MLELLRIVSASWVSRNSESFGKTSSQDFTNSKADSTKLSTSTVRSSSSLSRAKEDPKTKTKALRSWWIASKVWEKDGKDLLKDSKTMERTSKVKKFHFLVFLDIDALLSRLALIGDVNKVRDEQTILTKRV